MEEAAMRIATPQMLWLLLILVPPLILFFWWAWRKRQQLVTQFISSRLLGHLKVGFSPSRQKARMALIVIAVVFVIFALARPQWGMSREEARQRGLDIIVAIDTSNSMLAQDVSPNRLARAKLAALDLMRRAKTDRLGLVAFAGDAFLECPLTLDDAAFSQSVNALDTHTISQGGTAIAEAIAEARKSFKNESDNHKVLVLFTDGEDQDSDAMAEAGKAAKEGMIIFTVGIGTPEGDQILIRDERGHVDTLLDENGKPVVSHLNKELLDEIAAKTKGFYLQLLGTKTMDTLYDRGIAPLPKSDNAVRMFQHFHEQYHWPLAIAMLLLIAEMFLPDRSRRRSQPATTTNATSATTSTIAETVAILLLIALPMTTHASPASALREYNEGNYEQALKDYNKLLEKKKDDPRLHFNAGTAAYQAHQLDAASKEFNDALESQDLQLQQRAYYNLGNTLYRIGEQLPDAQKKQEAWENSMKQFESALKLNNQDADAKFNQDFVKKQLEELKKQQQQQSDKSKDIQPSEDAKKAKAAADAAVRNREYDKALAIMENQLKQDATTSYYGDYIQRLKEVNGVQSNNSH
jgi:Ca-activated chloride channel homolog